MAERRLAKHEKTEFEEIIAECSICGKKIKFVKRRSASIEGLICQKCGRWESEGIEGEDD